VPINTVAKTVEELFAKYPTFGGVADWEYFNTLPGGLNNPVKWVAIMTKAMGDQRPIPSHDFGAGIFLSCQRDWWFSLSDSGLQALRPRVYLCFGP
jgi:hypothetical protein